VAAWFFLIVTFTSVFLGILLIVACSSNREVGVQNQVCDTTDSSALRWWVTVLWPGALFAALHLALRRRHVVIAAVVTGCLMAAFWITVLVAV
jgi:hypothetical protein